MNSLELHRRAVYLDPFDKTNALALVDHTMEDEPTSKHVALVVVAKLRVWARRDRTTEKAARFLDPHCHLAPWLRFLIRGTADLAGLDSTVVLRYGWKTPRQGHYPTGNPNGGVWASSSILVGARWCLILLRCLDLYKQGRKQEARARLPYPVTWGQFNTACSMHKGWKL